MIRKIIVSAMAFFFVFSAVGVSFAMDKGNKRKGKYTYRKVYKACFERGAVESQTPTSARLIRPRPSGKRFLPTKIMRSSAVMKSGAA